MAEGKYVEYGQMRITALEHAVDVAKNVGRDADPTKIVDAAMAFYTFLVGSTD